MRASFNHAQMYRCLRLAPSESGGEKHGDGTNGADRAENLLRQNLKLGQLGRSLVAIWADYFRAGSEDCLRQLPSLIWCEEFRVPVNSVSGQRLPPFSCRTRLLKGTTRPRRNHGHQVRHHFRWIIEEPLWTWVPRGGLKLHSRALHRANPGWNIFGATTVPTRVFGAPLNWLSLGKCIPSCAKLCLQGLAFSSAQLECSAQVQANIATSEVGVLSDTLDVCVLPIVVNCTVGVAR